MSAPAIGPAGVREQVAALRARAGAHERGQIDCTIGTPCDPVPAFVAAAVAAAVPDSGRYPLSVGGEEYRDAAVRWMARRLGVGVSLNAVAACVGTKEFVATLPRFLALADEDRARRDAVLHPAIAYSTYAFGAQLAGCRAVPVPLDEHWRVDVERVSSDDARRARLLWLNHPANPTGALGDREYYDRVVTWARAHDVVVASDECYVDLVRDPCTALVAGHDRVLTVHSLSKRSNLAGMRAGFYAGDPALVAALADVRRDAGCIVPAPAQAAAVAALDDDDHVAVQRTRYEARAATLRAALARHGVVHDGGPLPFYLWLRATGGGDGWDLAARFARAGVLVMPGATFGAAGDRHVRLALVQPDDRIAELAARLDVAIVQEGASP